MKPLYKWLIGIVIVLGISTGVFFETDLFIDQYFGGDDSEGQVNNEKQVGELSEEKFEKSENPSELNPFGDEIDQAQLTDHDVQVYIHKMSHQKVEASEKWGFYLITDERIEWLQSGVEAASENLEHSDTYQSILNAWAEGDFSQANDHHNTVWELQDGTVGYARDVLTSEEEEAYINKAE
ncbi:DUF6241 domain-containing protein [Alkalibacillus sp. S2W]|uniref:DUF6241 domain-containing protein n=1 Tax=Alkalibacillus sp. S2W TaxID=3386553 RepID=UPI00398C94F4